MTKVIVVTKMFVRYKHGDDNWYEVDSISLGSKNDPNNEIDEIKIITGSPEDWENPFWRRSRRI